MELVLWWQITRRISAHHVLAASGLSLRQAHRLFVIHFNATPQQEIAPCC
jgi:hypothetical protein